MESSRCVCSIIICSPSIRLCGQRSALVRPWKQKRGYSMLLARRDESRHQISARDGLAGRSITLAMAIWSTMPLNFSNDLRNEEIQSTRLIGLSVSLTAGVTLWTGAATVLIAGVAFFVASSSRAASAVVTSGVSSRSDGVSWFIHEYVFGRKSWT